MKNIKYQWIMLLALSLSFVGCESVMDDKKNLESLVADDVWQDPILIKGFMDNVLTGKDAINGIPEWERELRNHTEESYGQYGNKVVYDEILISGDYGRSGGNLDHWSYTAIRNINKFLENVDKCPKEKLLPATRNQYVAQMLVLRAWLYFDMVRSYGGVPLILNEQRLDDDLNVSRAKTSECITQIVKDLDDAIAFGEDFPMKWTGNDAGRISRAVALALKARILLYYACPQFSKETPAGTKSVEVRWQEAYAASQAAVQQLSTAGYGLFRPNPADAEAAIQNYFDMFTEDNEIDTNPEMVWVRRYAYPIATSGIDEAFRGGMGVPLEMTNAFAKADGTPYTDLVLPAAGAPGSTLTTSTVPFWIDREPRFYTTIAYNGCIFPLYVSGSGLTGDEDATGRLRHFYLFNGGQAPYGDPRRMESSGLSMRKFIDDAQKYHTTDGNRSGRDWPLIRYAEVLLNYAETAVKTGHESDALQVLRDIRKRAGIPQGTNNYGIGTPSGDALILTILKERQVELAYESFRYYDLRRWRVYTDALNGFKLNGMVRHGIKPDPKGGYPTYEALAALDIANEPASYFAMFEDQIHSLDANPINFTERQYFYRLSYEGHIKKNPKLEQTILWEGGTFNPYE